MALTVPNPVRRVLYNTSKRVSDELGKGQEMLRIAGEGIAATQVATENFVIFVPDVDIIVVGARMACGNGAAGADNAEIVVPQDTDDQSVAAAAGNRLVTQITDPSTAEDVVLDLTLTGLNGNLVRAGQPIVGWYTDAGGGGVLVYMQISYVLAEEERTY